MKIIRHGCKAPWTGVFTCEECYCTVEVDKDDLHLEFERGGLYAYRCPECNWEVAVIVPDYICKELHYRDGIHDR